MTWKHGYFADSGYTFGFYPETMPKRLSWAALIQGHESKKDRFRYLDAGCGQGFSLMMAAAAHPESEFVGVDFLPEHIAHANKLAAQCGLTNVSFIEADFIELNAHSEKLGGFDYAVCHGITTWISPEVKSALFSLIGKVLNPGGVFYNGYNTLPGWLSGVPFQHLVLLGQQGRTGAEALKSAIGSLERLKQAAPSMFNALPGLSLRLESLSTQNASYLVQEYNNQYWSPVFVSKMIGDLDAVKLKYLGTATLPEAYDSVLAAEVRELLNQQTDIATKEQLRDYALNQSFRRDLYVKGISRPWNKELHELVRAYRVAINPLTARPKDDEDFLIKAGGLELKGERKFYGRILKNLDKGPLTVGELIDLEKQSSEKNGVISALSMLMYMGWVVLFDPQKQPHSKSCNEGLISAVNQGAPYRYASAPFSGSAVPMADTEWILLTKANENRLKDYSARDFRQEIQQRGLGIQKDGQLLIKEDEIEAELSALTQNFKSIKLPFIKLMGGI